MVRVAVAVEHGGGLAHRDIGPLTDQAGVNRFRPPRMNGTQTPPSIRSPLSPTRGQFLDHRSPPLSEENRIRVRSDCPVVARASRTSPMPTSMASTSSRSSRSSPSRVSEPVYERAIPSAPLGVICGGER